MENLGPIAFAHFRIDRLKRRLLLRRNAQFHSTARRSTMHSSSSQRARARRSLKRSCTIACGPMAWLKTPTFPKRSTFFKPRARPTRRWPRLHRNDPPLRLSLRGTHRRSRRCLANEATPGRMGSGRNRLRGDDAVRASSTRSHRTALSRSSRRLRPWRVSPEPANANRLTICAQLLRTGSTRRSTERTRLCRRRVSRSAASRVSRRRFDSPTPTRPNRRARHHGSHGARSPKLSSMRRFRLHRLSVPK